MKLKNKGFLSFGNDHSIPRQGNGEMVGVKQDLHLVA